MLGRYCRSVIDVTKYPPPDWSARPSQEAVERALQLNDRGRRELEEGKLSAAEQLFMAAIETVPVIPMPWFNLGLVYKRQRRWQECAACNRRSVDLGTDEHDPAYWNLGIAATALRDWGMARWAWRGFGVEMATDAGPIEMDLGPSPVRINPDGNPEVVWGQRLDPARIRLENIPLPGSGHRWHDVVLHDGEPHGERMMEDQTFPVFDEIERWQPSDFPTWECILWANADDMQTISDRFRTEGGAMEDWTASIRRLCRACSESSPQSHKHGAFDADPSGSHVGIAAPFDVAEGLLSNWLGEASGRQRSEFVPVED